MTPSFLRFPKRLVNGITKIAASNFCSLSIRYIHIGKKFFSCFRISSVKSSPQVKSKKKKQSQGQGRGGDLGFLSVTMVQDRQDGILDLLIFGEFALTVVERACWVRGAAEGVEERYDI